jgi:hypothetical protein
MPGHRSETARPRIPPSRPPASHRRSDTVGESFELNVAAAQEVGTLIGTAKPIILAQGSVWKNGIIAIPVQLSPAVPTNRYSTEESMV